jgi:hypothetical protein
MRLLTLNEMKEQARRTGQCFDELWEQQQQKMCEYQNAKATPVCTPAAPVEKASAEIKALFNSKPVVGDKAEKTPALKKKRADQALQVLEALINNPAGYTDTELVEKGIGGYDGGRRRRYLRSHFAIDFNKTEEDGHYRYSLSDLDHARRVLAAGCPVEKEL